MNNPVDINETMVFDQYPEVLEMLLKDHTTGKNIFWATDSYSHLGKGYQFNDEIKIEHITEKNGMIIRPRVLKERTEQNERTKGMAEVFTPSWVCNVQNNLVDDVWFGQAGVFNTEEGNGHKWIENPGKIQFPEGKSWKSYVRATRMEITCGEAPYLVSRYDTTTGEEIEIERRIGMLDRKLRVVGENTQTTTEWLEMAQEAFKHVYGYEWQGDNLLLAREALLVSFVEYYFSKFGKMPLKKSLLYIAYIISWNIWQMDGLKGVVPGSCKDGVTVTEPGLFGETESIENCLGCRTGDIKQHNGIYCLIRDWGLKDPKTKENNRKIRFIDLIKQ